MALTASPTLVCRAADPHRDTATRLRPAGPSAVVLDGVRVHLRAGTEQGRHGQPHPGHHARVTFWRLRDSGWTRTVRDRRRPDRVRRPACRASSAGRERQHAARHLPAALGVRVPGRARPWWLRYRGVERGPLLGPGQRVAPLQPLPEPGAGRVPLVAAVRPPEQLRAADRLPAPVRPLDRDRLQRRPGPAPGRDLPAHERARRDRRLRQRAAPVHPEGHGGARSRPRARDRRGALTDASREAREDRGPGRRRGPHDEAVDLEKVLYPRTGTTKGEVRNYYARIAPVMLPHLADRAVTRIRWPHGTEDMSFFEKNMPNGTPSWVRTVKVPTTGSRTASEGRRDADLPDRRRPRHLDLAGQPGRARAARAPVDGRPQRQAAQRRPAR